MLLSVIAMWNILIEFKLQISRVFSISNTIRYNSTSHLYIEFFAMFVKNSKLYVHGEINFSRYKCIIILVIHREINFTRYLYHQLKTEKSRRIIQRIQAEILVN